MSLTISEVQNWVERFEQGRGWADRPPEEKLICLLEEIGELATALKNVWTKTSKLIKKGVSAEDSRRMALSESSSEVAGEIVDCIIYLLSIANKFNLNMDIHLRNKMKINEKRKWSTERALKTGFK